MSSVAPGRWIHPWILTQENKRTAKNTETNKCFRVAFAQNLPFDVMVGSSIFMVRFFRNLILKNFFILFYYFSLFSKSWQPFLRLNNNRQHIFMVNWCHRYHSRITVFFSRLLCFDRSTQLFVFYLKTNFYFMALHCWDVLYFYLLSSLF